MNTRLAAIVVGLLAAGMPALAQESLFSKLFAQATPKTSGKPAHAKSHPPAKKPEQRQTSVAPANQTPPPSDVTGTVGHRKGAARGKTDRASAVGNNNGSIPTADRLAIEADLAWIGDYEGAPGGDFDSKVIEAIKLFQKGKGKETGTLSAEQRALLASAAKSPQLAVGWQLIDDPATRARFGLPEKLVSPRGASLTGSRWTSAHGQIQVETFRLSEAALPALFEQEKKTPRGRHAEFSALKPDSFVISGTQGLKQFVVRAETSGSEVRGITVLYDQATAGIMAPVALAMANTFEGFPDPNAGPPPGQARAVEYGTAVVVDRGGNLLATRQVTSGCEAIVVPGFGHAERVAEDAINDLALIRLYGARNLLPAPLADASQGMNQAAKPGDRLSIVGVADPLAQDGGSAVTSVSAYLNGQGVDPAPKLGFSGAAALDAQGHFAGIVELKAPVMAGVAPAAAQAILVPADAVRTFLAARAVTAAAGPGVMDQSVVRVICVRR